MALAGLVFSPPTPVLKDGMPGMQKEAALRLEGLLQ